MDLIDLHTHSTASDGSFSPRALVEYAVKKGAAAIALTDHDTIEGLPEALHVAGAMGLELVPGLEISADHPGGTMHILGYFINPEDPVLGQELNRLQEARRERNPKIIAKLQNLGIPVTYDQVRALAVGQVGRPHIAQAMLQIGAVKTLDEAFKKFLTKGAPAYVEKFRYPPEKAVALIIRAGGVPVLAHPFTLKFASPDELRGHVSALKDQGLKGLECLYSEHSTEQTRRYSLLAADLGLAVTGGTDFHGKNKESVDLLTGYGALRIPYRLLEELKRFQPGF
ncbi:MAG: PHP domain-containing protein [Deltaproteobacteria bacterium]|nr:PHP domain-containing protein [Deltaproteobacteria bacterium]